MAITAQAEQEQPGQEVPQAGIPSTGGAGVGGAATKQASQTKAASTPGVNVPQSPSSQLSAYLNANQGQATQQAGQIAGTLGNQTQAAGNAVTGAVNTYTGQLNPVTSDTTVNQQVENSPSGLTQSQQQTYTQELGAGANAPNSANTFESSSGYGDLASQVQNAVEQANLWNSGNSLPNLTTALQPFEQGNTTGGQTLDAYLLSQTPQAYSQIQNAVAPAAGLQSALTTGTAGADTALQNAITQDQATTTAATQAAQQYATNLNNYLNQGVSTAQQNATNTNNTIATDLTNNTLTASDIQALGLTPAQVQSLQGYLNLGTEKGTPVTPGKQATPTAPNSYGVDLSTFLQAGTPSALNVQNFATPTQYADVAALQSLLGANAPTTLLSGTTQPTGTAPTLTDTFNASGAAGAVQTAQQKVQQTQALDTQGKTLTAQGQKLENEYKANHAGGQTPDQFNAMIGKVNAQIAAINKQLTALGSPTIKTFPLINAPNNSVLSGLGITEPEGAKG